MPPAQSNRPKIRLQTSALNCAWLEPLLLRLAGHDQARGIRGGGFQRLPGEEDNRGFHDRENEREERRRHHARIRPPPRHRSGATKRAQAFGAEKRIARDASIFLVKAVMSTTPESGDPHRAAGSNYYQRGVVELLNECRIANRAAFTLR